MWTFIVIAAAVVAVVAYVWIRQARHPVDPAYRDPSMHLDPDRRDNGPSMGGWGPG